MSVLKIDKWRVRRFMEVKGLKTHKELAEQMGVSPNTVHLFMTGSSFTSKTLQALCDALEVYPADVIEYEPDGE